MTYSFDNSLADDVSVVRFHVGDNHDEGHYLEDETIQYFIDNGSIGIAVVRCIQYIITQLSTPNFRQDWLTVSNEQAREGYEKLLKQKATELGVPLANITASSSISLPYRADSYQDPEVDTHDGAP